MKKFPRKPKQPATLDHILTKIDQKHDEMAVMVKTGFDNTATKRDFDTLSGKIDKIDDRLGVVETKLDRALYTELTQIEARLKKVEQKIGIKTST